MTYRIELLFDSSGWNSMSRLEIIYSMLAARLKINMSLENSLQKYYGSARRNVSGNHRYTRRLNALL